jgi:hypothetical protein
MDFEIKPTNPLLEKLPERGKEQQQKKKEQKKPIPEPEDVNAVSQEVLERSRKENGVE